MTRRSPFSALCISIIAQVIGFTAGLGAVGAFPESHSVILVFPILVHSLVAFAITRWLSLSSVWQVGNILLPLFVAGSPYLHFSGWTLGGIAVVLLLIFLPTLFSGVPYYPTSEEMYRAVEGNLPETVNGPIKFIDLGCGFSGLLRYLASKRPDDRFEGVEIGIIPFFISWILCLPYRNIEISFKSMWNVDLSKYDTVYAFLAPPPMPKLWKKVAAEMKKGSTFMTNSFPVPEPETMKVVIGEGRQSTLYIHNL